MAKGKDKDEKEYVNDPALEARGGVRAKGAPGASGAGPKEHVGVPKGVGSAYPGREVDLGNPEASVAPTVGGEQIVPRHNDGEPEAKDEQKEVRRIQREQGMDIPDEDETAEVPKFQGNAKPDDLAQKEKDAQKDAKSKSKK